MLVYNTEHILTTLKRWKTSWYKAKYLLFYYVPSYYRKGHSVCMLIFTARETKQIKLIHIGLAQGISKMTTLKATCIALCQSSAWLKVSHLMFSCPRGWRGDEVGASSPSSCTTGLKQIQNKLHAFKISFPCTPALPPKSLGEG